MTGRGLSRRAADFIDLAKRNSGQDLGPFFQVWLFEEGRPASW